MYPGRGGEGHRKVWVRARPDFAKPGFSVQGAVIVRRMGRWLTLLLLLPILAAQDWRYYAGDAGGSKYSRLDQINQENVASLKTAWTYHIGDTSDGKKYSSRSAFECTPLVIDGVMYVTSP